MVKIRDNLLQCLSSLDEELERSTLTRSRDGTGWLLAIASGYGLGGLLLLYLGGYHAGFQLLNDWSRHVPAWLWENITFAGDALFVLTLLLFVVRRHPGLVWAGLLAALLSIVYAHGLKELIYTYRPLGVLDADSFQLIGPGYRKNSFPSGHSMSAFLLGSIVIYHLHSTSQRLLVLAVVTLIGLSRVAVGVHWPFDVLAGAFGGVVSAMGGIVLSSRYRWGLQLKGYLTMLAVLVLSAVLLIWHRGGYPGAAWLAMGTGLSALVVFLRTHLFCDRKDALGKSARP